jgi:hypothetical protein
VSRILVAIVAAIVLAPVSARAQERVGDAALGAVSGALVLGPVGALAGAVVGFTAGPSISHAWGIRRSDPPPPPPRRRTNRMPGPGAQKTATRDTTGQASRSDGAKPAPPRRARVSMPPVQTLE